LSTGSPALRIRREGVVIAAESHDIWGFTPDFLVESSVIPEGWTCHRATRSNDVVEVQFGPTLWRMTPAQLWVTEDTDRPPPSNLRDYTSLTASVASRYLGEVPHTPVRTFWFFWRFSVAVSEPARWLSWRFLSGTWPTEFGTFTITPQVVVQLNDLTFNIGIRTGRAGTLEFDCYVRESTTAINEMMAGVANCGERLQTLVQMLSHLLKEGRS
jgi:hypothetical protein